MYRGPILSGRGGPIFIPARQEVERRRFDQSLQHQLAVGWVESVPGIALGVLCLPNITDDEPWVQRNLLPVREKRVYVFERASETDQSGADPVACT